MSTDAAWKCPRCDYEFKDETTGADWTGCACPNLGCGGKFALVEAPPEAPFTVFRDPVVEHKDADRIILAINGLHEIIYKHHERTNTLLRQFGEELEKLKEHQR